MKLSIVLVRLNDQIIILDWLMLFSNEPHKQSDSFLNSKVKIELPSNLLHQAIHIEKPKTSQSYKYYTLDTIERANSTENNIQNKNTRYQETIVPIKDQKLYPIDDQYPKSVTSNQNQKSKTQYGRKLYSLSRERQNKKFKTFFQEKNKPNSEAARRKSVTIAENGSQKVSLYRKLSQVRENSLELRNMSFSKMISQMVIMQDNSSISRKISRDYSFSKVKQTRPITQKTYNLRCPSEAKSSSEKKKSNESKNKQKSKNLFNRFFVPPTAKNSQNIEKTIFHETDATGRYVYKNKKIESKRIHNFYATDKFKKGYHRYIQKTLDNLKL